MTTWWIDNVVVERLESTRHHSLQIDLQVDGEDGRCKMDRYWNTSATDGTLPLGVGFITLKVDVFDHFPEPQNESAGNSILKSIVCSIHDKFACIKTTGSKKNAILYYNGNVILIMLNLHLRRRIAIRMIQSNSFLSLTRLVFQIKFQWTNPIQ